MAGLISKLTRFASSPQGQAALAKAKAAANDPKNRAKIDDLVAKAKQRAGELGKSGDQSGGTGSSTTTVTPVEPQARPVATREQDGPAAPRDTPRPAGS